jgi:hypothetical protein
MIMNKEKIVTILVIGVIILALAVMIAFFPPIKDGHSGQATTLTQQKPSMTYYLGQEIYSTDNENQAFYFDGIIYWYTGGFNGSTILYISHLIYTGNTDVASTQIQVHIDVGYVFHLYDKQYKVVGFDSDKGDWITLQDVTPN